MDRANTILMKKMTQEDQKISSWAGGETKQLFIWPMDGDYASRRFEWRISTATVEVEESDFSDLTGFERWIMTVDGSMTLSHGETDSGILGEGAMVRLDPYQAYRFDGGLKTKSKGIVRDFNLMTAAGWQGEMIPLKGMKDYRWNVEESDSHLFIHCLSGNIEIGNETNHVIIINEESIYLDSQGSDSLIDLKSTDGSDFSAVLCKVWKLK